MIPPSCLCWLTVMTPDFTSGLFFCFLNQLFRMPGYSAWLSSLSLNLKLNYITTSKFVGQPVAHSFQAVHNKSMLRLANSISSDSLHVLHGEYQLLPSNMQFRVPTFKCNKLNNYFIHQSILLSTQDATADQGTMNQCDHVLLWEFCLCCSSPLQG